MCTDCGKKFCPEHVHTADSYGNKTPLSHCHKCYHDKVRVPWATSSRAGMTARELYLRIRELLPKDYISITVNIIDGSPGQSPIHIEWQIYHEKYMIFKGETPEAVLASFTAAVKEDIDPTKSTLDNVNV